MTRALPHLVGVEWLAQQLGEPDLQIVDTRWKLGDPGAGERAYRQGHLPGALFADVDRDLASPPGTGERGRHPLPTAEAFSRTMERLGISDATRVIAYDDQGGAFAARLWFLLRYFGHETGAVLDGGLPAWLAAGRPLEAAIPAPPRGAFTASARPELIVSRERVSQLALSGDALVLDARAPERYRGDLEPIDARAGHIPGAVNAPFAGNLRDGRFLPAEGLAARFVALGADRKPTVVYCGSGVTACHDLLALAAAGLPIPRLYPGSWSEWARQPDAAVAVGEAVGPASPADS